MHKTFKLNIQAVLKNGDRVLLLKRNGKWTMPGGRYEDTDRSLEEALLREIKEETGIDEVNIGKLLHAIATETSILLYYSATTKTKEVIVSHEHDDSRWVSMDELNDIVYEYDSYRSIIDKSS